ncbi:MAG TPA: hypothetical protein VMW27_23195, partial [Thermoanaerobaculia bacterium]|nr:hypothetical protein [Thermoanaerobaculia bacterium]
VSCWLSGVMVKEVSVSRWRLSDDRTDGGHLSEPKKPMFELQRVFPPGNHRRVLQIRFLMASQALAAIFRVVDLLPRTPATAESKNYLMMLSIGAANEAAIAFLEADRGGALDELLNSGWIEMQEIVARLRQECDEHIPSSLRKQILLVARNTMGSTGIRRSSKALLVAFAKPLLPSGPAAKANRLLTQPSRWSRRSFSTH